jgi:hypothetical protein
MFSWPFVCVRFKNFWGFGREWSFARIVRSWCWDKLRGSLRAQLWIIVTISTKHFVYTKISTAMISPVNLIYSRLYMVLINSHFYTRVCENYWQPKYVVGYNWYLFSVGKGGKGHQYFLRCRCLNVHRYSSFRDNKPLDWCLSTFAHASQRSRVSFAGIHKRN